MIPINKRKIGVCILLSLVTLGIYKIYWEYLLVKNIRAMQKDESSSIGEMLCLVFVPFYSLYWWFTRGKIVKEKFAEHGYSAAGNENVYLILGIFGLDIVSMAIMQNDFNFIKSEPEKSIQQSVKNANSKGTFLERVKAKLKESLRRFFVFLKKNPPIIPIAALAVSFLIYSLNLTAVSNTTAKIYGQHMGLCSFVSMLFMILSFVCMLGAYPKRQKPKWVMIILATVMYLAVIGADLLYYLRVQDALTREQNPITLTVSTMYIWEAQNLMIIHIVSVAIVIACMYLEPTFAKLLKKINTSIEVESNEVAAIELSEE